MHNFNSILIANRGEIACRVIRTAKKLGTEQWRVLRCRRGTHLMFNWPMMQCALAPDLLASPTLVPELILQAAASSGAEAIHPGYGFLSENAAFADAVETAGLVFIGPTREAIDVMGNKAESKRRMIEAGVPCVPGYEGHDQSDKTLSGRGANKIDLPLMVKAAAGGGGRGMRLVHDLG